MAVGELFLLTEATQFLATAMVIEIIHWPVIFNDKKGMLTVEIFQDWSLKNTAP